MVRRTRTSVRSAAEFPDEFAEAAEDGSGRTRNEAIAAEIDCPLRAGGHLDERGKLEGNFAMLRGCYPRGSGGFARVFQWLESCMTGQTVAEGADDCPLTDLEEEDLATLRDARIVMIGHSMGTIVINELLQLFPNLPYESLVYMAGAASVRDTARAVTPVLVNNRGCTKFYGLMLHPMNEARESTFYSLLPSGSLLVYVDEFLEVPKTVPDRTVGHGATCAQPGTSSSPRRRGVGCSSTCTIVRRGSGSSATAKLIEIQPLTAPSMTKAYRFGGRRSGNRSKLSSPTWTRRLTAKTCSRAAYSRRKYMPMQSRRNGRVFWRRSGGAKPLRSEVTTGSWPASCRCRRGTSRMPLVWRTEPLVLAMAAA
jgi:hypothetical protein